MGKKFWNFIKNESSDSADLQLYGEIADSSWWGDEVTPKNFKDELDALGNISVLNVYINSPGGDVFAGQAIHSMLKRHKAQVNVYVDGLAASIASVIAMAGDKVIMPSNAMMMIHDPWTIAAGNAQDFRKMADDLDKIKESLIAAYLGKATNLDEATISEMMKEEKWLTAQEAVEYGFADEVEEAKDYAASLKGRFLSLYKNIPQDLTAIAKVDPKQEPEEEPKQDQKIELLKAKLALELAI